MHRLQRVVRRPAPGGPLSRLPGAGRVPGMSLYDFQTADVARLRTSVVQHRSAVYVLPTGGGKTVVAGEIARGAAAKGTQTLLTVHRRELVQQAARTLQEACPGLDIGYIAAGLPETPWAPMQIGMVQTLARRDTTIRPGLIVVDEAHHVRAATWERVLERWPDVPRVLLTATPERLDGKGLGEAAAVMVEGPSIRELVAMQRLAPVRVLQVPEGAIDRSGLRSSRGDYTERSLDAAVTGPVIAAAGAAYMRYAAGRSTIFFGVNRRHSMSVAEDLTERGVKAEHVDGTDHPARRDRIMGMFRDREIEVICNVDLVSEGFDAPSCDCVMLGRLTRSITRYLQASGRAMRYQQGKTGLILDLAGSSHDLGLPDDPRVWTLEDGSVEPPQGAAAPPQPRPCRACQSLIRDTLCPFCGALQGEDVVEVEVELAEARVRRRGGRAARQALWHQLARAQAAADPLAELQRIAAAHGHRSAWTDQMRRVLKI